jgi:hypothetical protein
MAGPFKMKGSPMARNFGAPFKDDRKKKYKKTKEGMEKMSTEELQKVAQRNIEEGVTLQGIKNIDPGVDLRTDSVRSAIEILKLRENE